MFGVLRGEGAVMLSYNSTYTRSITNSSCTPPAPCTLHPGFYIPYRHRMHAYVYASLRRFITSTYSYRARAHARNATTSSCVVTPTATAHALHNLNPGGRTGQICNVAPCTYNLHVHMHRNCACAFNLHSHLGRNAPPSATVVG